MRRLSYLAVLVSALGLFGCGGDGLTRVPVQGKVTAANAPLANATVQFLPAGATKGEGGIGTTDAEGNFALTGSRRGDGGVVPGTYKVCVSRYADRDGKLLPPDAKQADYPDAFESIPAPYCSNDSPLEVTISEQGGVVSVDIPVKPLTKQKKK